MTIVTYLLALAVSFILGAMASWIPLTIMHAKSGNSLSLWWPDPGNEERFIAVHTWGQAFGALAATLVGLFSILWVFSWFDRQPHIVLLIIVALWNVFSVRFAEAHYMPVAQYRGARLGAVIFFVCYLLMD